MRRGALAIERRWASEPWSLWHVVFPQLEVVAPGKEPVLLIPRGPGEEQHGVWQRAFSFQGTYPSGWTSMQFMAAYDRPSRSGLYWAIHDPLGGTKELSAKSLQPSSTLMLAADIPVPDMGKPGNSFQLNGEAVWQVFAGDWYDAAVIYRDWVRQQARWYPQLGNEGRDDTPAWMRELCVWAQAGGTAASVRSGATICGVPGSTGRFSLVQLAQDSVRQRLSALFPTGRRLCRGSRKLQESNVYVMPYINGRLWDTRDQGAEDFEFTRRALPAATKDENGEPYTETYGSKESDGSPVRLAVMCPTTAIWQERSTESWRGCSTSTASMASTSTRLPPPRPNLHGRDARSSARRRALVERRLLADARADPRQHEPGPDADHRVQCGTVPASGSTAT